MAINVTLAQLSTLNNTSILQQSNANFSAIQTALLNALSLSNQNGSNQMQTNLDMNGSQIINLPPPATANSPVRLVDVTSPATIASVPPVGTGGGVVGLLNANKTDTGNNVFTGVNFFTGSGNSFGNIGVSNGEVSLQGIVSGTAIITTNNTGTQYLFPVGPILMGQVGQANGQIQFFGNSSGACTIGCTSLGGMQINGQSFPVQFLAGTSFSVNGSVATSLGSVGPSGAHTTVQEWLTILDASGTTRYIPCF